MVFGWWLSAAPVVHPNRVGPLRSAVQKSRNPHRSLVRLLLLVLSTSFVLCDFVMPFDHVCLSLFGAAVSLVER